MSRVLRIAAAVILDSDGRMLVVRKAGTEAFMQPGGKLEPGESGAECLVRELEEELGLEVAVAELDPLGRFAAPAANEVGWTVEADLFRLPLVAPVEINRPSEGDLDRLDHRHVEVRAEIAEARWCTREELLGLAADGVLAPLTRENLEAFLSR